jgi:hypothetical protein
MRTFTIDSLTEEIKDVRTKKYFEEVISSYYTGNYRSSIVMLYTVVICDLVYKLQELRDVYNDDTSKKILDKISTKQQKNKKSPEWETDLIVLINDRTELFEHSDYINILHLQKNRHICAHPIIQQDTKLYSPSKETVAAHILNMLNGLLTKSSLLSKKILEYCLKDVAAVKDIMVIEDDFSRYIKAKYINKFSENVINELFKSLWTFVFSLKNADCDKNRNVNFRLIRVFIENDYKSLITYIENNSEYFSSKINCHDADIFDSLINFLSEYPQIYSKLNASSVALIKGTIEKDLNLIVKAWFLSDTLKEHIVKIEKNADILENVDTSPVLHIMNICKSQGEKKLGIAFLIRIFSCATNYDLADLRFDNIIQPQLNQFTKEDIILLIEAVSDNSQIYERRNARFANYNIKEAMKSFGEEFDYSGYTNFR